MSEFDVPISRRWVRSVESEQVSGLRELADAAAEEVYEMWFADDFVEIAQPYKNNLYTLDDEAWQDFSQRALGRPYVGTLDRGERRRVITALNGRAAWIYTSELLTDGLWDEVAPTRTGPVDTLSRYVLSGAAGDALAESDPNLIKTAEHFTQTPLDQRILIGAAALYGYHTNYHRYILSGSYTSTDASGLLEWATAIGGSVHGDFRTERLARPTKNIADTTNVHARHFFMPALYESESAAYHGTERGIASGLLYHLVVNANRDPQELRADLLTKLEGRVAQRAGAFADYGDADGRNDARLLRSRMEAGRESEPLLYTSVIEPGNSTRFELHAEPEGVAFCVVDKGVELQRMHIPNNEIEAYITTMIMANGGRVSPTALLQIIDALQQVI